MATTWAADLLSDTLTRPTDAPAWHCATCSETIEPQFAACWNCGALRGA